ncbi:hypothetical protein F5Y09DRAFT_326997 [Xylaria sp. FL1042]|nr:hypothetical protein F5Y09DRAFT_326997 [Xylaria sp. FL1042]
MRDLERCNREEVDGGYLLCYPSELFIEVRANADWLPLVVQWNEKAGVFEGLDGIDGRRLEVDAAVMIDVMCGGVGQHVGFVYEGRQR